jgi:hypothetical protein
MRRPTRATAAGQAVRITRVQITIRVPAPDRPAARPRRASQPPGPRPPCPDSRRDQVTRIMASQPGQDWPGSELASRLGVKPGTCSPSSPSGPASASSPKPAAAATPCLARPAPPPAAPDRNPEIATTLLTSSRHA